MQQIKCSRCFTKKCFICQKCFISSQTSKLNQIQQLKAQIQNKKQRIQQLLNKNYIHSQQQQLKNRSYGKKYLSKKQQFTKSINSIAEKQNKLAQIKKLKKQLDKKLKFKQQCHIRHKQKLNQIHNHKKYIHQIKQSLEVNNSKKTEQLKETIKIKSAYMQKLNHQIKLYIRQVIDKVLITLHKINQSHIKYQKNQLFAIKQVQQLDFMLGFNSNSTKNSSLKQSSFMMKSFYQLQNIQQLRLKKKTSEKGLHLLYQNILIVTLLKKIFNIWLPYPIDLEINLNQSKLITKLQQLKISNVKVIDFSKSFQISRNIVQFFPSKIQSKYLNKQLQRSQFKQQEQEEQLFQNIQINQDAAYHKRRVQLNKCFMNYLQVNLQYLNSKFGIKERPLIFCDKNLILKIIKEFIKTYLFKNIQEKKKQAPYQIQFLDYRSMLKQVKVTKLLQTLQKRVYQQKDDQIKEESYEQEANLDSRKDNMQEYHTSYQSIESKQTKLKQEYLIHQNSSEDNKQIQIQSMQEIDVPSNLIGAKSSSTDNDQFQLLI